MKKFLLVLSVVFTALLTGCSSDSNNEVTPQEPESPTISLPAVTTLEPIFNAQKIRFKGNITSEGSMGYAERGVCWGNNTNPIKGSSNYVTADGSGLGEYFIDYNRSMTPFVIGGTYNIRAFVKSNNGDMIYGNNLTITLPSSYKVTLNNATDIVSNGAKFTANIAVNYPEITSVPQKGFCISATEETPTIENTTPASDPNTALGLFTLQHRALRANTTYYVRAYAIDVSNKITYSNTITFRTLP